MRACRSLKESVLGSLPGVSNTPGRISGPNSQKLSGWSLGLRSHGSNCLVSIGAVVDHLSATNMADCWQGKA